jgi:hypothetical protein
MSQLTNLCAQTLVSGNKCLRETKSGGSYCWLHDFKSNLLATSVPQVTQRKLNFLDEMTEEDLGKLEEYVEPEDTESELFGCVISTKVINQNKPVVLYFDWDGGDSWLVQLNGNLVRFRKYIYCDYRRNWENKQTKQRQTDINITTTIGEDSFEFMIDAWDVLRFSDYIFLIKDDHPLKVRVIIDFTQNMEYNLIKIGMIETD